ncbi:MAG: stage III sporulation protein AD [Clostridia bacterium]|nr:stage III sporulation protein AD [Clostridia bacterium]
MIKTVVFALAAAVVFVLLKRYSPEYSALAETFAAAAVLLYVLPDIISLMNFAQSFFDSAGTDRAYFSSLLKITGIALLTQFSADTCRDSGESALASQVEFAGKILMIVCAVPVIKAIFETVAVFTG